MAIARKSDTTYRDFRYAATNYKHDGAPARGGEKKNENLTSHV